MQYPSEVSRANNFNCFRLLFAVFVMLSHSFELLDGNRNREPLTHAFGTLSFGELAVDGFFLLSGYLIVQSWCHSPKIFDYLIKRVLRIYPGFVAASLVCLFVVAPLGASTVDYFDQIQIKSVLGDMLFLKTPQPPPFSFGVHYESINGSMWSIRSEFRFYLAVSVFGVFGLPKWRKLWLLAWICIAAVFLVMEICRYFGLKPAVFGLLPFNNVGNRISARLGLFFFAGGIFYLYRDIIPLCRKYGVVSAALLFPFLFSQVLAEFVLATAGAYLLFVLVFSPFRILTGFQSATDVSYGLYLYGWPLLLLLIWKFPGLDGYALFIASTCAAILAGFASWHLVERPFMGLRRKLAHTNDCP